jgi:hypothetical protein
VVARVPDREERRAGRGAVHGRLAQARLADVEAELRVRTEIMNVTSIVSEADKRGDIVTVVLTKGRVKIETRGVANNDAGRGETVMVTSASNRTQLTGVAEASGTVVVRN